MCLFFHKWSRWSEPVTRQYTRIYIITGKSYECTEDVQTRKCEKCGIVQEKEIKNV